MSVNRKRMAKITKLEAAERLIISGIAMSDEGDDPLAIHVVASSALNMLRELIQQSGDNYVARVLKEGLFHSATSRMKDQDDSLPSSPEIDEIIDNIIAGIEAGDIEKPTDLIINLNADELRGLLGYIMRPYNFLKHAQRDPLATLDESDVDPKGAIVHAVTAIYLLDPSRKLPDEVASFLAAHGLA